MLKNRNDNRYPELVATSMIDVIEEAIAANHMKTGDFYKACWPGTSPRGAYERWRRLRKKDADLSNIQGLLISDFIRMAVVLDQEPSKLMLLAEMRAQKRLSELLEVGKEGNQQTTPIR